MAQTTEASCLLQSGAMYPRRVGFRLQEGEAILVGLKAGGVSIYFGDAPILHFDLEGRWQRAFIDGTHYLKGLDGVVRSIDRERESTGLVLRREKLPYAEAADLDASIRSIALGLIDDLDSARLEILPPPSTARIFEPEEVREFFERVVGWDSAAWFAHVERYLSTYGPMPFLPPDSQNALILQATLGDRDGMAFGGGSAAEHYVRNPVEFDKHAREVARLTARRISQHKDVFLGGPDLLARPVPELLEIFNAVASVFPIVDEPGSERGIGKEQGDTLGPVRAFLGDLAASLPDLDGWRALRLAHLGHVTLGVESGDPEIRALFGKTWADGDLKKTLGDLKSSGIGVGLVVLVGAGGRALADRHVEATTALLASLPLTKRDLVTLVDVRALGGPGDLLDEDSAAQALEIKARAANGPKLVVYNPLKRWS